jgi:peptide/nickel transport system ATP-binding protein
VTPGTPLLEVDGLAVDYVLPRRSLVAARPRVRALDGVSITLDAGGSLGIVGESGCGKSTLARATLALERPSAGSVRLHGQDLATLDPAALRGIRRHMQMIFQDPYGSLDPRQRVERIVNEPLRSLEPETSRDERRRRVAEVLDAVGLSPAVGERYPHEFSGGQRQRIAIARALVTHPDLVVADEPVSALDVSVQAQVLNLMMALKERLRLAYLFITHDLSVVRLVTDRVAVMYLGRIVEQAPTASIFQFPRHPYTKALLDAIPRPDAARHARRARAIHTPISEASAPTSGCPYAPRCPLAEARCWRETPELRDLGNERKAACHVV